MALFEFDSVGGFLAHDLDRRKNKNQNYSMRAYARDLGISVSTLSELLKGTAGLSEKNGVNVAEKLKLGPLERKYFLDLILAHSARNKTVKELALERIHKAQSTNRLREIKEAQFRVMADWYHGAILELVEMKGFQSKASWVAEQLGITVLTAASAINRLKKLGLVIEKEGRWSTYPEAFQAFSATPSVAIQKFHSQILNKTLNSLQNDPMDERLLQSMIVAIPNNQLPLFHQKMKAFMQDFWEELSGTEKDDLYSVSIQMTPMRSKAARKPPQ